ncbi:MAG: hypothetical protein JRI68_15990 [Deltaproteobacteria bacterium]|nr:hypothetical protein [Deltaproteobacteria bacterium]
MMGKTRTWMVAVTLGMALPLAGACDDETSDGDDDDGSGGSSSTSSNGSGGSTSSSGTGGSSSGTGGSTTTITTCQLTCAVPGDCSNGLAAYDADNYSCDEGWCQYLGCNNDTECQDLGDQVCRDIGVGFDSCVAACNTVPECAQNSSPYDEDNYSCADGWCQYQGCNGDSECQTMGNYVCRDVGGGTMLCVGACSTPADCDIGGGPAYDADNYSCDEGWCRYLGCNSDAECQALGDYVCR